MNTTNWLWNASLSKTLMKGNLILKLDAVDILNQISNIQHAVNAQGQTETWINNLSGFAMMHIIYKLNVFPKNQKQK